MKVFVQGRNVGPSVPRSGTVYGKEITHLFLNGPPLCTLVKMTFEILYTDVSQVYQSRKNFHKRPSL